jgi:putative ABC transport system substrate-binding protein
VSHITLFAPNDYGNLGVRVRAFADQRGGDLLMIRRREFIAGLGGAVAWAVAVRAQQAAMPVIGYIGGVLPADKIAFLKGLAEAGYVEGRNVAIEYHSVDVRNERLPGIVSDLVGKRVAVIAVVISTAAALAAKAATQDIPIVFRIGGDPVASGLVPSLARPGGNLTGVTTLGVEQGPKRLQLLLEILPADAAVALLTNPTNANAARERDEIQAAARLLGVRLVIFNATTTDDIKAAFVGFVAQGIGGFMTAAEPLFFRNSDLIVALAARHAIPAIYSGRPSFDAGGLMIYASDMFDAHRWAGVYTGRILKGERPADLPVQESTKVELALNLKVAKALGITFPTSLLVRADEVIE